MARQGSIQFMTKSRYYRLEKIGPPIRTKTQTSIKVKAFTALIEAGLAEQYKGIPTKIARRQQRQHKRAQKRAAAKSSIGVLSVDKVCVL